MKSFQKGILQSKVFTLLVVACISFPKIFLFPKINYTSTFNTTSKNLYLFVLEN